MSKFPGDHESVTTLLKRQPEIPAQHLLEMHMDSILTHYIDCERGYCYIPLFNDYIRPYLSDAMMLDVVLRSKAIRDKHLVFGKTGARAFPELLSQLNLCYSANIREYLLKEFKDSTVTAVPPDLIIAYRHTSYRADHTKIEIRIGKEDPVLSELCRLLDKREWCFITAYNPYSSKVEDKENRLRQHRLRSDLEKYLILEGEGVGDDGRWAPEPSLLVLGIDRKEAIRLGRKYSQNAIVAGSAGCRAELLLLRECK